MSTQFFINALGWSLIHSLWQGAVIYLALYLVLQFLRRAQPQIKYWISFIALTSIFICFLFTLTGLLNEHPAAQDTVIAGTSSVIYIPVTVGQNLQPGGIDFLQINVWINYFVWLYATGLIFFIGKIARDFFVMKHIRTTRVLPFDKSWDHYLDRLCTGWKISGKVKLFLSEYIDVPVVIGYLKPVIYLPFTVANHLTSEQIEAILLHELAHVKRNDFLINLLQTFIETILFFNPFVWLISKMIREERENCCDDLVLSIARPGLYAQTLLALEEKRLYKGQFVMAAAGKKQQLYDRIKRIMERKTKKLNIMQKLLVLIMLAAGILSVSWLVPEKKESHTKTEKITILKNESSADTTIKPVTPVAPSVPSVPPAPSPSRDVVKPAIPEPPSPPTAIPSAPAPVAAITDTFPNRYNDDSLVGKVQRQIQQYFNSDTWKKYQKNLQTYQQHLHQYFQSKEWKGQQQEIHQMNLELNKMAKEFKSNYERMVYSEALKAEANKMREMFNNPVWKARMDSLKQRMENDRTYWDSTVRLNMMKFNKAGIDSLVAEARKNAEWETKYHPNIFNFNKVHTMDPNQIVSMLEEDGLIKNTDKFSVRLNESGLYIDGKKQNDVWFRKYQNMIGNHSRLEIVKKGTRLKSSVNTNYKENKPEL